MNYHQQYYLDHKEEWKERSRQYYLNNKEKVIDNTMSRQNLRRAVVNKIKEAPCMDCKTAFPPECMDFDHRPGVEKIDKVSNLIRYPLEYIEIELKKCDLVCANCHRIRTKSRLKRKS